MAKLTLTNILSGFFSNTAHNANNAAIVAAMEKTLSRDGTSPNAMGATLDMNSNKVINLPVPVATHEAARLADVQNAIQGATFANLITNVPSGTISSTSVQGAINEINIDVQTIAVLADDYILITDPDDAAGVNRALAHAKTLVAAATTQGDNGAFVHAHGGAEVLLNARNYVTTSATIEIPQNVTLRGSTGKGTSITSAINGQIIRNADDFGITYGQIAGGLCHLRVYGDRTKALQIGVDLLRMLQGSTFHNVEVSSCGSTGVMFRECISTEFYSIDSHDNVGTGIIFDQGVSSWAGMVADGLPCNACNLTGVSSSFNDGDGVKFLVANGNVVEGTIQYNNKATGVGYYVEFLGASEGNRIRNSWLEGKCTAFAVSNTSGAQRNYLDNCRYITTGSTLTGPSRAAISIVGELEINGYSGLSAAWPTIAGSTAPFRCTPISNGKLFYKGPLVFGSPVTHIEDPAGTLGNHALYAYQEVVNASTKIDYGVRNQYYENGEIFGGLYRTTGVGATAFETTPWVRFNGFLPGIEFDKGSSGKYAGLYFTGGATPTSPEGALSAYPGSICITSGGSGALAFMKTGVGATNTGWLPLATVKVGNFAMSATASKVVNDVGILSTSSVVIITPVNVFAGTLQGGAGHLYHDPTANVNGTSFTVKTANGLAASGNESFNYIIVNN